MRVASRAARRLRRVHAHPVLSTHYKTESIYTTIIETYMKGLCSPSNIMYEQTIEFLKKHIDFTFVAHTYFAQRIFYDLKKVCNI